MAEKARPGEELWLNTGDGRVWFNLPDPRDPRKTRATAVEGKATLRITTEDREANILYVRTLPANNPFLNGVFKRVDQRAADEPIDGQQVDQALSDEDLVEILATKNGRAFHAAVAKMSERNVRRLAAIIDDPERGGSTAQKDHVDKVIVENFRPKSETTTAKEILAEKGIVEE